MEILELESKQLDDSYRLMNETSVVMEEFLDFLQEAAQTDLRDENNYKQCNNVFNHFARRTGYPISSIANENFQQTTGTVSQALSILVRNFIEFLKKMANALYKTVKNTVAIFKRMKIIILSNTDKLKNRAEQVILATKKLGNKTQKHGHVTGKNGIRALMRRGQIDDPGLASALVAGFAEKVVSTWLPEEAAKAIDKFRNSLFSASEDLDPSEFDKFVDILNAIPMRPVGVNPQTISPDKLKQLYWTGFSIDAFKRFDQFEIYTSEVLPGNKAFVSYIPKIHDADSPVDRMNKYEKYNHEFINFKTNGSLPDKVKMIDADEIKEVATNVISSIESIAPILKKIDNVEAFKKHLSDTMKQLVKSQEKMVKNSVAEKYEIKEQIKLIRATSSMFKSQVENLDKPAIPFLKYLMIEGHGLLDVCVESLNKYK